MNEIMFIRLIKLIISIFVWILDRFIFAYLRIVGKNLPSSYNVIFYHGVSSEQQINFKKQIEDILKFTQPISIQSTKRLEKGVHYIAVTFDDGFVDILENALPILIRYNIPVIIFIPTGCLGHKADWKLNSVNHIYLESVMTAEQLKEISRNKNISIGSHSVKHQNFLLLTEEEVQHELYTSKLKLENLLEKDISYFSFPYGAYNEKHIELAKKVGYKHVFTIMPVPSYLEFGEYIIGRVEVSPADWHLEFRLKILGTYRWLPRAFSLKRKFKQCFCRKKNKLCKYYSL